MLPGGGGAGATYRKLIEQVIALENWNVVASVRTFDLRMGMEWKRLFFGVPADINNNDPFFPTVRHIKIPLLSDQEFASIKTQSPELGGILEASDKKLLALVRNPFNLTLLSELVTAGVDANSFSTINSKYQLLGRYWETYVGKHGLSAKLALKNVLDLMISRESIEIPEISINPSVASAIETLQHEGVLADNLKSRIAFRHHILFDFALYEILLMPDVDEAMELLKSEIGIGFLISPALGYWFEHIQLSLPNSQYWETIFQLLVALKIDPLIRVESARLIVSKVIDGTDLSILKVLIENDTDAKSMTPLSHLAGAMISQIDLDQPLFISPWLKLLANLNFTKREYSAIRSILDLAINRLKVAPSDTNLGISARKLMSEINDNENLIQWLSPNAIPFVAQTSASNPKESKILLEKLFEPTRFKKFGYIEIYWLTRHLTEIAKVDGKFAVEIYRRVFLGGDFSGDEHTSLGNSWILSLRSNPRQDYNMCYHSLSASLPDIFNIDSKTGVCATAAALDSYEKQYNSNKSKSETTVLFINKRTYKFRRDHSYIWASRVDNDTQYDDFEKIYKVCINWSRTAQNDDLNGKCLDLLKFGEAAIVWRAALDIATQRPEILASEIWPFAINPTILFSLECRHIAVNCIVAIYPYISTAEKEAAEKEWLQCNFPSSNPEETKALNVGVLFKSLGIDNLKTPEAKTYIENLLLNNNLELTNETPYSLKVTSNPWTSHDSFKEMGINKKNPLLTRALLILEELKNSCSELKLSPDIEKKDKVKNLLSEINDIRIQEKPSINAEFDEEITSKMTSSLGDFISCSLISTNELNEKLQILLELSSHMSPKNTEKTEENFANSLSWGIPSTRIQAAESFVKILSKPETWNMIRDRYITMLLKDPHPGVRFTLVRYLPRMANINEKDFWNLLESIILQEKNIGVLEATTCMLSKAVDLDANKAEHFTLILLKKVGVPKDKMRHLVDLVRHFALTLNFQASIKVLEDWKKNFEIHTTELSLLLSDLRTDFILGFSSVDLNEIAIRENSLKFVEEIIKVVRADVIEWPVRGGAPTEKEQAALKVFLAAGDQFYYGTVHSDNFDECLPTVQSKKDFLTRVEPIIRELVMIGTPANVHHMLELLEKIISADPKKCFDLLADSLLRPAGIARYEHEPLGATLIVKLIGLYLADYRQVFDDRERRTRLVRCLELFVDAGWSETRKLLQRLPELLQ